MLNIFILIILILYTYTESILNYSAIISNFEEQVYKYAVNKYDVKMSAKL